MLYQAIFLDMDHTLCDTASADTFGVRDFAEILSAEYPRQTAQHIAATYLQVIYGERNDHVAYRRSVEESDLAFRGRLLQLVAAEISDLCLPADKAERYAQHFMDLRIKHFAFFPGTTAMLRRLRQTYTLVLVTNGPPFSQEPKLQKVAMASHVDHILLGGLLPHQKPHPSIFSMACEKARCRPEQAVHVGDKLSIDIKGANDSGITSIWINPDQPDSTAETIPDHTIALITDLEALLTRINREHAADE